MNPEPCSVGNVILSANVSHYYHTALALQQAGMLKRYICAIGYRGSNPWLACLLPDIWRKKLHGRDISAIDAELAHTIWTAEILQRGLPAVGLVSDDRGNWLNNYLYDFLARRWVEPCEVFHFVNSVGLYSARKAKACGSIVICDVRTVYPDRQLEILTQEYSHLGLYFNPPGQLYDKKIKAEYTIADYIFVPSSFARKTFLEAGFDPQRVFMLPYGIDPMQFFVPSAEQDHGRAANLNDATDHPFRIIYAGQIVPGKGVHYLLAAFDRLHVSDAQLLLVGRLDPTMEPTVRAAMACDGRIRHIDTVPKSELQGIFRAASVLVLPSLVDSWGLVVLEAMACGLPVIVTENTGSSEVVNDGVNGFVIPIRSPEAIEERLVYLYKHCTFIQQMGLAARETASHYTWQLYGQRLLQLYRVLLGAGACRETVPVAHS